MEHKLICSSMEEHIDSNREDMFRESVDEVKTRLDRMCEAVAASMVDRADDVYQAMSRDYLSVMGGSKLPEGQVMPRWERKLRADVLKIIEGREQIVSEARIAKQEAREAEVKRLAEEEKAEAERAAADEKRDKEEAQTRKKQKSEEAKAAKKKARDKAAAKAKDDEGGSMSDEEVDAAKGELDKDGEEGSQVGGESAVIGSPKASQKDAEEDDDIMDLN